MNVSKTAEGILVTRTLLKQEIDKVREGNLIALYNIIKVFGLPAGTVVADAGDMIDTVAASAELNWEEFVQETYGCLKDDPIERGSQGEFELREAME